MAYSGRTIIYTDEEVITSENVVTVLSDSTDIHKSNRTDIEYLYNYYKGEQPILNRQKAYNEYINNKVLVNRANEIVSFKSGYLMGEPVQYTARSVDGADVNRLNLLNDYCYSVGKSARDMELADWFHICGTSYRMVLPTEGEAESPFEIYTLDPRTTFVVYHSGLGHKPICGVTFVENEDGDTIYSVYTEDTYYEIVNDEIVRKESHFLKAIPIIEYPANEPRLGAFEIVITMLDAINTVASNRVDGIEQFIQSLMVFKGVEIDDDAFRSLKELGGLKVPIDGDVKYLIQELNQTQTQTIVDDMYETVLEICGMPSQGNANTSDSSNNGAMIIKNGWQQAEARAKDTERMFKESERKFLEIVLRICNTTEMTDFRISEIDIRFTRRNYENILQKAQVLTLMLSNSKIHPRLAYEYSGMFIDPELAYAMSEEYINEQQLTVTEETTETLDDETVGAENGENITEETDTDPTAEI